MESSLNWQQVDRVVNYVVSSSQPGLGNKWVYDRRDSIAVSTTEIRSKTHSSSFNQFPAAHAACPWREISPVDLSTDTGERGKFGQNVARWKFVT
jgi:hypothetical protein